MNDRQKVLFRQLQLVIFGLVILVGGILAEHRPFIIIGILVGILGMIRYIFLHRIISKADKE